jgi:signal transduction histidine kinase
MEEGDLITYALASTLAFFLVSGFTVYITVLFFKTRFRKQEELLNASMRSVETEQQRMGIELHDGLNPTLAAIKMSIEKIRSKNQKAGLLLEHEFDAVGEELDKTQEAVRRAAHNLKPVDIEKGLIPALDNFIDKMFRPGLRITWYARGVELNNSFAEVNLFRIIQELITNSIKHANGSYIKVYLFSFNGSILHLVYKDNGGGMQEKTGKGIGLQNISNRVALLKGDFRMFDNKPRGLGMYFRFDTSKW